MAPPRSTKKTSSTRASSTKRVSKPTFLKSLPESVEHIEIVQQVASVLEELQKRVLDVKAEASRELKKLMKLYESNYKGIEKKVHKVTSEAKKQAQTSMIQLLQKWHEHKDKLPKPMASEIERIIDQIGEKVVQKTTTKPKAAPKKRTTTKKKASVPRARARKPSAKMSKSVGSSEIEKAKL